MSISNVARQPIRFSQILYASMFHLNNSRVSIGLQRFVQLCWMKPHHHKLLTPFQSRKPGNQLSRFCENAALLLGSKEIVGPLSAELESNHFRCFPEADSDSERQA